jgi:hypothetical protein
MAPPVVPNGILSCTVPGFEILKIAIKSYGLPWATENIGTPQDRAGAVVQKHKILQKPP